MSATPQDELAQALRAQLMAAATEREPLSYESLEAFVDGTLDEVDREIVETRLADDPGLRAEVDDLRALRAVLPASAPRGAAVVPIVPAAERAVGRPAPRARWILPVGLAAAAMLALIVWRGTGPLARPDATVAGGTTPSPVGATPAGSGSAVPGAGAPGAPSTSGLEVALQDGGRTIGLSADGTLVGLDALPAASAAAVRDSLRAGMLPDAPLARLLTSRTGQLLGDEATPAGFVPLSPVATTVRTAQPVFRWTPLAGATAYRVRVVDQDLEPVAEGESTSALAWTPATPLPRGRVLIWQVEADTPDGTRTTPAPPLPEARLFVLEAAAETELARALAAANGSDLAAAMLLAQAGLHDDADAALRRLAAANPGSPLPAQLRRALAIRRGGAPVSPS